MRLFKSLLTLLIFPLSLLAQSKVTNDAGITGLWTGTLYNDSTHQYLKYEIGISTEKGKFLGFSHTCFNIEGKAYFGIKKLNIKKAADGKIIIVDEELVLNNYPGLPAKNVKQLNVLTLNTSDSIAVLSGPFVTNRTKDQRALTGSVSLRRKNEFWLSAIWPYLLELDKEKNFAFIKEYTPPVVLSEPTMSVARLNETKSPKK
jgi:hypothetical protein